LLAATQRLTDIATMDIGKASPKSVLPLRPFCAT